MNRILRLPEVSRAVGLSRSSIYQKMDQGRFPNRVKLGGRAVGWRSEEVEEWMKNPYGYRSSRLIIKQPEDMKASKAEIYK